MTQNIFYGGDDYDLRTGDFCPVADGCPRALHRLAHIIAASGADVVGVQEAERNTRRLAAPARLARQPAGPRDLALPDPRPARTAAACSPTSSRCPAA